MTPRELKRAQPTRFSPVPAPLAIQQSNHMFFKRPSPNSIESQAVHGGHMSEDTNANNQLLARIEKLERQNRNLKRGALACLIVFASFGVIGQLMGQTTTQRKKTATPKAATPPPPPAPLVLPKDIEAESFTLKDANGKVRAELSMSGEGPSFKLRDQAGTALVTLSVLDTATGGPLLLLSDPQHLASVSMSAVTGQGSQLSLIGARPDIQAHIGVAPDGTTLELSDKDGFATSIGSGFQPTKNGQGKQRTAASITLLNKDRKLLWSTP
jgi:hypothetical protein